MGEVVANGDRLLQSINLGSRRWSTAIKGDDLGSLGLCRSEYNGKRRIAPTQRGRASGMPASGRSAAQPGTTTGSRGSTRSRQTFTLTPQRTLKPSSNWTRTSRAISWTTDGWGARSSSREADAVTKASDAHPSVHECYIDYSSSQERRGKSAAGRPPTTWSTGPDSSRVLLSVRARPEEQPPPRSPGRRRRAEAATRGRADPRNRAVRLLTTAPYVQCEG